MKPNTLTIRFLAMFSIVSISMSSPTTIRTLDALAPTSMTMHKSVSFEARDAKSLSGRPIIMQTLSTNSYFPQGLAKPTEATSSAPSLPPSTESPEEEGDINESQASSLSYASSWTPMSQNSLKLSSFGQPAYFPAPAMYGNPVNNYQPPPIHFGGSGPSSGVAYGTPADVKQELPTSYVQSTHASLPNAPIYNVPVKSIEYVAPVKTEIGENWDNPQPQYNAVRNHDGGSKGSAPSLYHGPPPSQYGSPKPGPTAEVVELNYNGGPPGLGGFGSEGQSSYGVPASGYGVPTAKKVHNIHQNVLHRYNHHQKILHEHNLHRYIIHNYHLHRFHIHNIHQHKENIHVHKHHTHNKYEQKETEEHKTKETEGETHEHVKAVTESHRQLKPIYRPLRVVKTHWSPWG